MSAITQLVSFLTRPLMRSHTPATIIPLQNCLQTALSASPESTLLLSASCPPPTPIQRACLLTGVRWADWIRLLSEGLDVEVFISEASLAVKVGTLPRRTLFNASVAAPIKSTALALMLTPSAMPFASRLRAAAALTCTRTRRGAALHPTRIPTLLSSSWEDDADASESESDSDSDSDYASDCASESSFTSASSATSVSSSATPSPRTMPTSPWFRSVPAPKADLAQYKYAGGITRVMSGGVMLGRTSTVTPALQSRKAAASWRKTSA
ncbi:hypothetical protein B0H16DRAFT_1578221 [Mycena metata]|uniref:Uncharacterized protein n=1 Tax=Mycena metata TaxID=1033252 RepID=A0AAD7MUX7_9AGAR|nr:hypothetical protein B0H16DRAFT_1578221 [Mycena metata]